MKRYTRVWIGLTIVASILLRSVALDVAAQDALALTGTVTSAMEGKMEGVVVTARRDGATFAVSVVSDSRGRFGFPRTHLEPGSYALNIRAVGYDLGAPARVDVTRERPASVALRLQPTQGLASQLSTLEWIMSMPGTPEQKDQLAYQAISCAYCHTFERILKSKHSSEEFVNVISRMQTYFGDGTAVSNQSGRGRGQHNDVTLEQALKNASWGSAPKRALADYLASVNLSGGRTTWSFPLKTLPRPHGAATRVIITQYDLPRKDTVPHDMTIDSRGVPWYPDQSRMVIGKLDPSSGKTTEYPLPSLPEGRYGGVADMTPDRDDNIWFTMAVPEVKFHFGWPVKFDPKSGRIAVVSLPDGGYSQFVERSPLDGKIWMNYGVDMYRVDPATMKVDAHVKATPKDAPSGARHFIYQVVTDSKGNPWGCDLASSAIVGVDTSTGTVKYFPTPSKDAFPRRGRMDSNDRFWFGEYFGDRIGMLDTRSETIREWPMPYKYTTPYTASEPDGKGRVYAPSNTAERLIQLDPRTGQLVEFQMPTDFDTKKVVRDPTTTRSVFWMANTRNARIVRVEPLN
jgi:streptogramin lyase